MVDLPANLEDTPLARLFLGHKRAPEAAWFSLPGGRVLFHTGEDADRLYFLVAGRLGVVQKHEGQEPRFIGIIRPGEPAGEMAMIAGTPHTATVMALRAPLMILRARHIGSGGGISEPAVYGFTSLSPKVRARDLVEALELEIAALGYSVTSAGAEVQSAPTEWFSNLEENHDIVLYAAEDNEPAWKAIVGRQVDRLFGLGRGHDQPPAKVELCASPPLIEQQLIDLILIQKPDCVLPSGSGAWLDAAPSNRLIHIKDDSKHDLARLARMLVGRSVGLVLSGGGARAYAHIGAIRALHEANLPIDLIGGASMGAIIAGGIAMGWSDEELDWRIRKAFVDSNPLDDVVLPLVAMTKGGKVRQRLLEHFGDAEIPDLWLPYCCVSSDLTAGAYHLHKRGKLRDALEATVALPGILPPVTLDGHVLVDGAVLKNFPTDIMRSMHLGPVLGVDVAEARGLTADDVQSPVSAWRWLASGGWRRGAPIVSILMRTATVSTSQEQATARDFVDVFVAPELGPVEIRDWKAYGPAVDAGYRATREALSKLDKPLTELRRRPTLAERREASRAIVAPR